MLKKILIFCILCYVFVNNVSAYTLFEDNFDNKNYSYWNFIDQDGSIITENGILKLRSSAYLFPVIYSKIDSIFSAQENVVFETKFKFSNVSPMGNGISVGFTGPTGWPFYQFSVWGDSSNGIRFISNNFNTYNYNFCNISIPDDPRAGFVPQQLNVASNEWHYFRIEKIGSQYKIYFDKKLNPLPLLTTNQNQCIPKNIFIGNPLGGGGTSWTSIDVDYVKAGDGDWDEKQQYKIILIPGMGASWNERAMVLNQVVPQSEWRMTPFVHNYDSLISSFEQNGLVTGTDYFVYNYDWRKSLDNQVNDFNTFVNGLGLVTGEKIDIVGHSLGGVIGRIWTQENSSKVNKILTLASPNSGSVKTYEMWNGAKIANPLDSGSIALNVLLSLQRKNNQSSVETMRQYVPIVKDLLPTFDYLKKGGKIVAPMSNAYLANKNLAVSSIFSNLLTVSGYGFNTTAWINLEDRNVFDSVLGRWELGKPVSYIESDGDGTVLIKSAIFEGDGSSSVSAKHGDVPNKSVNIVLAKLGLGKTISEIADENFVGAVFYIGSPATMKVNCGDGDILENEGFVLVSQKKYSECQVNLVGNANGTYHLVMGNSNDAESWKYAEGNIVTGEEKNISINSTDYWYLQMKRETEALLASYPTNNNLKNMMMAINSKNRTNLLNSYLLFRKQKLETVITWRMVNYLEQIINLELPNQSVGTIEKQKVLAMGAKVLADKTASLLQRNKIYPKVWQSLNYNQGEDLLKDVTYGKYLLAEKIFAMVWN